VLTDSVGGQTVLHRSKVLQNLMSVDTATNDNDIVFVTRDSDLWLQKLNLDSSACPAQQDAQVLYTTAC